MCVCFVKQHIYLHVLLYRFPSRALLIKRMPITSVSNNLSFVHVAPIKAHFQLRNDVLHLAGLKQHWPSQIAQRSTWTRTR